jgi:predicted transposase/invertase (TIGR01784 family)
MIVGIDPKVDYAFKHLFGRDATRPLLAHAIDSVLEPAPGHAIRDLELRNPFNPKEALDDKLSVLDIKARDETGRQFNVEMQMLATRSFVKRIIFYAAKLYQQHLHESGDYQRLRPTISISFVNAVLFPESPEYPLRFRLWEDRRQLRLSEDLEFHILELPKFNKAPEELSSDLDIWLYFLRHAEKMDTGDLPPALRHPLIERALEELKMLTQNEIERERYESRLKAQRDHVSGITDALAEGLEKGEQIGLAKGEQIGIAKGEQIGIAKGKLIGQVNLFEQLLQQPETPTETLAELSIAELTHLADRLRKQIATR